MPWYYYSGKTVRPIPVKKGLSRSVRPGRKIEISEITQEAQALISKKELRRCAPPGTQGKGMSIKDAPVPEKKLTDVLPKSEMARKFAEKGRTTSPGIPPKTSSGKPEMTEGEMQIAENGTKAEPVDGVVEAESLPSDGKKKNKKGRRS
jgi:hypothetical protein